MKRCLLIAPVVSHATLGRVAALGSTGYELYVADTRTRPLRHSLQQYPFTLMKGYFDLEVSNYDPLYKAGGGYPSLVLDSFRSRGLLPESKAIAARLCGVVDAVRPNVVVTYYAATAIHFARILRRHYAKLPIVLIHNTLPITLERMGCFARRLRRPFLSELIDYTHWLASVNVVVCASNQMADFAERKLRIDRDKLTVLPDYFPQSVHARALADPADLKGARPKVIFLGAPERWGPTIDNLDAEFLALVREGIEVHSGEISNECIASSYGHKYPYFSDDEVFAGKLAQFAHGFDAALITYGVQRRRERFRSILPTRFLTALTAGVPIAVKAGMFDAVEAYIAKHGLGFAYDTPSELRVRLEDDAAMTAYRSNAAAHLAEIGAERQAGTFEQIFDRLLVKGHA